MWKKAIWGRCCWQSNFMQHVNTHGTRQACTSKSTADHNNTLIAANLTIIKSVICPHITKQSGEKNLKHLAFLSELPQVVVESPLQPQLISVQREQALAGPASKCTPCTHCAKRIGPKRLDVEIQRRTTMLILKISLHAAAPVLSFSRNLCHGKCTTFLWYLADNMRTFPYVGLPEGNTQSKCVRFAAVHRGISMGVEDPFPQFTMRRRDEAWWSTNRIKLKYRTEVSEEINEIYINN